MDHLALEAPSTRLSGVLVCVALLAASSVLSAPASETPRPALLLLGESDRLAGVLPFRSDMLGRWCWSGAWLYPVGDPHSLTGQPETRYVVSRGIELRPDGSVAHQGVDLSNRRAGGLARGDEVLERAAWWRMVARAARHDLAELPSGDAELCRALAARRLLAREPQESDAPVTVRELERDLRKIKRAGLRVPAYPAAAAL